MRLQQAGLTFARFPVETAALGTKLAALRESGDPVGSAIGQRLNGHRGLATPGSYQTAAITKEKVLHIVRAMVGIDNRGFRIVAHAACAEKAEAKLLFHDGK